MILRVPIHHRLVSDFLKPGKTIPQMTITAGVPDRFHLFDANVVNGNLNLYFSDETIIHVTQNLSAVSNPIPVKEDTPS